MNFIHENMPESDKSLFFGDDEKDFIVFSDLDDMSSLVTKAGSFSSRGQAKKNGWNKPVPAGFSTFKIGKKFIWILNTFLFTFPESCV